MIRSAIISVVVLFSLHSVRGSDVLRFAVPRSDEAIFYRSSHDTARADGVLKSDGRYVVLDTKHPVFAKIIYSDDRPAYVRKSHVVVVSASARFAYGNLRTTGYVENPDAIFVGGISHREDLPIRLERSFRESLSDNRDRDGFRICVSSAP